MGEISVTKLLVIVVLVALVFGTKKLSSLGSDLGTALKGFKKAMGDSDSTSQDADFHNEQQAGSLKDTASKSEQA
ncbi:twin-arginine translocase subunit TatA [Superficieibacter electus]|uniref:Sec-independent protein translocase protein TatA n=1 Tax=Superficieibacter electus TaxID=2022662 RepID=A0A2P5GNC5_9ENTR|nr:twin-arginine translocase TatA/TatE family subunit [Superficieibacter electus]POP43607.1 twin-arginine translocase subunit TatA [Superficieibacter electus]POP48075.1 twin-arginine translocase subunit TatA [Superficieibacter electus]